MDSTRLASLDQAILAGECRNIRSLLVVRHGALVFERYYLGYGRDSLQFVYSDRSPRRSSTRWANVASVNITHP